MQPAIAPVVEPDIDEKSLAKALGKAKIKLMLDNNSVFFTTVCFSLKTSFDKAIPTAGTDGLRIIFNPRFFASLNVDEQVFLLLHETMHAAYKHQERVGERDRVLWNMAADYVINDMLITAGFQMPAEGLHDTQYKDMNAEEVYELLVKNPPPQAAQANVMLDLQEPGGEGQTPDATAGGSGAGQQGGDIPTETMDDILIRASLQSKMAGESAGSIPGDLRIYIDSLVNPKLPWGQILRRFMTSMAKTKYSFRRPNRRFFPDHIIPSLSSEGLATLAIAVDTSCSVTDEEFHQFISETYAILKTFRPKKIEFIQFDTAIKSVTPVKTAADLMDVEFKGRGGTCIEEPIQWAKDNNPNAFLMFTDGGFSFSSLTNEAPACPVIWLIHENPNWDAPYGRVIHYDL